MSLLYHHRTISRLKAEELLLNNKDGSFLVRDSETIPGAYTLCVVFQGRVYQYRILPDSDGKLSVQAEKGVMERKFTDLSELIQAHIDRGDRNGLVTPLRQPVCREITDDNDKESEEPEEESHRYHSMPCLDDLGDAEAGVSRHLLQRFSNLDLSNYDGEFINDLRSYVETGVRDDLNVVTSGGEELSKLRQVLDSSARQLQKDLDDFMAKIDVCRHLFGQAEVSTLHSNWKRMSKEGSTNLHAMFDKLSHCKTVVTGLEKMALKTLKELAASSAAVYEDVDGAMGFHPCPKPPPVPGRPAVNVPASTFEAKLVKHGKITQKVNLAVDIQGGKLFAVKPSKDVLDSNNTFPHDSIQQLVKSTSNNCRLDIKIEGRKKDSYMFDSVRQRENFCQLVQQLKNTHSKNEDLDQISLFIGTWNMGSEPPNWNLGNWLKSHGEGKSRSRTLGLIPHDLYAIGTQESSVPEKEWINKLQIMLRNCFMVDFSVVASISLWGVRLVILVKPEYKNQITHIQQSTVKTGIANALGNKGAVGISLTFSGTTLCFVNCHLTSGHEKNARRNQNFRDIVKGLSLVEKKQSLFDITNQFHHIFWFGDLNYRIDGLDPMTIIRTVTQDKDYNVILENDQLLLTQRNKEAFVGFNEEEITFPPTYRFEKGTKDKYVWQKFKKTGTRINVPSWCDRILWKSFPDTYIANTSYGFSQDLFSSDHKAVFSSFDVGIFGQFVATRGASACSGNVSIIFEDIQAEVKTTTKQSFLIEFQSPCLEGSVQSAVNTQFGSSKEKYCCPRWVGEQLSHAWAPWAMGWFSSPVNTCYQIFLCFFPLGIPHAKVPQLEPIFDDRDYLDDQHIQVAIRAVDGEESYGECVLALKSMFGAMPQPFDCSLTHQGEETGKISGRMHVKSKDGTVLQLKRKRRSYELVYLDHELSIWDQNEGGQASTSESVTSTKAPVPPQRNSSFNASKNHVDNFDQSFCEVSSPIILQKNFVYESGSSIFFEPPRMVKRKKDSFTKSDADPLSGKTRESSSSDHEKSALDSLNKPPVPPRKPRLGQSSYNQTQVLPVVSPSGISPLVGPEQQSSCNGQDNKTSTSSCPELKGRSSDVKEQRAHLSKMDERKVALENLPGSRESCLKRRGFIDVVCGNPMNAIDDPIYTDVPSDVPIYSDPAERDCYENTDNLQILAEQRVPKSGGFLSKSQATSPPVPSRRTGAVSESGTYEDLSQPKTVSAWLHSLGLAHFATIFLDQGWDQLEFIGDLTNDDLLAMGMTDLHQRTKVLHSMQLLGK